jgi:hypothetical protein
MFEWLRFFRTRIAAHQPERATSSTPVAKAQRPLERRTEPDQIEELKRIIQDAAHDPNGGAALPHGPRPKDHSRKKLTPRW